MPPVLPVVALQVDLGVGMLDSSGDILRTASTRIASVRVRAAWVSKAR